MSGNRKSKNPNLVGRSVRNSNKPKPDIRLLEAEGIRLPEGPTDALPPEPPADYKSEISDLMKRLEATKVANSVRFLPVEFSDDRISDNPDFENLPEDSKRKYSIRFIHKLARYGLAPEQIADVLQIRIEVLNQWQRKDKLLAYVLRQGKDDADRAVADSLYRKAVGMAYDETVTEMGVKDGKETQSVKTTRKFLPPDTQAAIFWLTNRQPGSFKQAANLNVTDTKKIIVYRELAGLSDTELAKLVDDGKN